MGLFMDLAANAFANYVQNKDTEDVLKSLVFITSYKASLNREYKKMIAKAMQIIDEDFSVFRDEDKIDSIYNNLKNIDINQFFENILSLRIDRDKIIVFFTIDLFFVLALEEAELIMPQHIYNLYLVKKYFNFSKQELANCYKIVANLQEADFDDTAEAIEALTSNEAMEILFNEYPNLLEIEERSEQQKNLIEFEDKTKLTSTNPLEEIETAYYKAINNSSKMSDLDKRLLLVNKNQKLLNNALKSYAKDCINENIIVQYDDSSFNNGKVGFLLTNKNLYIGNSFEKGQKISLLEVKFMDKKASTFNSSITVNSTKIDTVMCGGKTTEVLFEFLHMAIPLARQLS